METKVISDPLYGYIKIKDETIYDLIKTRFFQRLRRISHLSTASLAYPTATHTRFTHCLGVYELARQISKLGEIQKKLSKREIKLIQVSGLLHDIGHGPFSHSFDSFFKTKHEEIGANIILNDIEIRSVLDKVDKDFAKDVSDILIKKSKYKIVEKILSNNLDIDRLDYLRRDAYFTATSYGVVDLQKIIRSIYIFNNDICFKKSGISAIENFLINRYHSYWQVYYHNVGRIYEVVLFMIYKRVYDLIKKGYKFKTSFKFFENIVKNIDNIENNLDSYLYLDDCYIYAMVSNFSLEDDDILKTLSNDFLFRQNWESEVSDDIKENNSYFEYYNSFSQRTYSDKEEDSINIYEDGKVEKLINLSDIIKSLKKSGQRKEIRRYYRKTDA